MTVFLSVFRTSLFSGVGGQPRHFRATCFPMMQSSQVYATSPVHFCQEKVDPDMFIPDMENPYESDKKVCILCKYKINVDYKNTRLLSQFVSPYTGFLYDRHITGLCKEQQNLIKAAIKRSRDLGYMPYMLKNPKYLRDPKLFD
ncbi:28S ribosomal protein S18c, mitochondrial, partial [Stegodyphus mimosarum]